MSNWDEPILGPKFSPEQNTDARTPEAIEHRIKKLVKEQRYGVLSTQGRGQPYGSLMAYALDETLKVGAFATHVETRKYKLLKECDRVALSVDNRSTVGDNIMAIQSFTATGRCSKASAKDYDWLAAMLTTRHPNLKDFITVKSCVLFRVDIFRFFHVMRFQEVCQWIPHQ
ncbi:MAG: pyridoxamine 5'-phosphate oxidase family protein [Oligoflexales bacterium]|nr:pyridoxamine 5'-phosphate oxidase family protein [Oligoflexales bacterium]